VGVRPDHSRSPRAPYLNGLAGAYGAAPITDAVTGATAIPRGPYILLTSGSTDGICDDQDPKAHR